MSYETDIKEALAAYKAGTFSDEEVIARFHQLNMTDLGTVECKVVNTVDIGSHTQITGEVVNIQADESILDENGKYSLEKLNPIIYDEEHWRYLSVGVKAANAFKAGLVYKNK